MVYLEAANNGVAVLKGASQGGVTYLLHITANSWRGVYNFIH